MDMDVRRIIIDRMEARGVTQADLAEMTGMTRPRVNAYLRGHRDIYVDTLIRICKALDLDIKPTKRRKGR